MEAGELESTRQPQVESPVRMANEDRHRLAARTIAESGEDIARIMASLSNKGRLVILSELLVSPSSFAQLRAATGLGKTALAHHLAILVESGLVGHPARGRYQLTPDGGEVLQAVTAAYSCSRRRMDHESSSRRDRIERRHILKEAVDAFQYITSKVASHTRWGDDVYPYPQPCMYLVAHLVCMHAAGWGAPRAQPKQSIGQESLESVDFDMLAAVSGASALFAYQPGSFRPKYANLSIGMDERIEEATGFGFEWMRFDDAEGAWRSVVSSVDSGRPATGWYYENVVFAGYQDALDVGERKVFAMADGPEYFTRWWTWEEFADWVGDWSRGQMGRHSKPVRRKGSREVALRVMKDLVRWSTDTPASVTSGPMFGGAKFGLEAMEAYANDCEDLERFPDWVMCHDVNPQWTLRNSTSVYLRRAADAGILPADASAHIRRAAREYRAAFDQWHRAERHLGHSADEEKRRSGDTRRAGAATIRKGLEHERSALDHVRKALAMVD
jgi:DNA-binding HxlR family transcriptional regulator